LVRQFELVGLEKENLDDILSSLYTFLQPADFTTLSDAVRRMTGGNPFYLFEITGLMEDEGYLVPKGDNRWVLQGDLAQFAVPETINSLIERRIDRLSLNEILLLRAASLQGESFESSILDQMFLPSGGEDIKDIMSSLQDRHGLIQAREAGRFVFSHHQVHRVVTNGMSPEDSQRGHREVARLLESQAMDNTAPVPHHLIAHHLALSGDTRDAAEHFLAAGKRALRAQQFHMALDNLQRASDLLKSSSGEDSLFIDTTLALLEAVKPLGERLMHDTAIKQIKKLAEQTGRHDLEMRGLLEESVYLRLISAHEGSLAVAEKLIERARELEDSTIEAAALKEAGTACYLLGKMDKAEENFHQAAGILASTGDRAQLARVYNNLGLVCRNTQRLEEMVQYYRRALDIFREIGDATGERFPLGNLGLVYFERGEYERAFECFSALKASLGNKADLMIEGKVDLSIGEIYYEIGLLDEAREACERALNTFITIGNRQGESEVLGTLGGVHLYLGDIQIAKGYFEQSLDVKRAIGNMVGMLHSQVTLARIANMEGRHEEALYLAEQVLEGAKERDLKAIELEALSEIMQAKSKIESPTRALKLLTSQHEPEKLKAVSPSVAVTFAYKVGELAFQAGDEARALKYIGLAGRTLEKTLESIQNPEWREAYRKKRERIFETYVRLKPALAKL
jgi:tetratricopeptide (TPR) repeat protein